VGISYGKISTQPIVSMTIRYKNDVKNANSNLTLTLSNGSILEIHLQKSGLAYIGNSQVCQAIFALTESQKDKLKLYTINNIRFSLDDGLYHTLDIQMNKEVLQSQIKCL
jgi:hypothetical protein